MLICRPTSTSLGEIIHIAQSLVGKVLSNWDMTPPMAELRSTKINVIAAELARSRAACIPAMPPPTTITAPVGCVSFAIGALWLICK